MLKTPSQQSGIRARKSSRFFYGHRFPLAGRAANTTPAREICPPSLLGFERLAAISLMAHLKRKQSMNLTISQASDREPVTMTSLELVDFINSQRQVEDSELRHRDFTAKVPKVLGEEMSEKFRTSLKDRYGRDQPGYRFPKREACLMAMSYSYDIQAKVFDRMTELEAIASGAVQKTAKVATPRRPSLPQHVAAHLMIAKSLEKAGVRKEIAQSAALEAIRLDTGMNVEPFRLALPAVNDPANLNQTQVGKIMGLSSVAVGKMLRDAGLLRVDESGTRVITEEGLQFGEMKPYTNGGHSGIEPRWKPTVVDFLRGLQGKEAA